MHSTVQSPGYKEKNWAACTQALFCSVLANCTRHCLIQFNLQINGCFVLCRNLSVHCLGLYVVFVELYKSVYALFCRAKA